MPSDATPSDTRVVVLPVTRRDGEVTCDLLARAGLECAVCKDLTLLADEVRSGIGALMLTEAALVRPEMPALLGALRNQPAWSDVPVVMLIRANEIPAAALRVLETMSNVTVLDRPVSTRSMISAIQSALRDRRKQYRIRDQLMQQTRAEQALMLADQRKDEFLATLAHELRNPLAPIRTGLHILAKMPGGNERAQRLHEINAAKYTPNGGRIRVVLSRQGGDAMVSVEDSGVGIPDNMLDQVFDMFAQVNRTLDRSQGGLGIGLSLVRRLMELHGGTVEVHSEGLDCGSKFTVRLPALAEGQGVEPVRVPTASVASINRQIRVLIVDDNTDAAETLAMLLESHGHQTRRASSAPAGLRVADEFHPEAVFCDIEMAGMNGYEVATRLRRDPRHAGTVLVAVTGRGTDEDKRRSLGAGFDLHLTKPISYDAVKQALVRL